MSPSDEGTTIVRAAIHPAIGITRVGNSPREYFMAPEVVDPEPAPPGSFRDDQGALKRQAARFRVYGYNADGQVVAELTSENAEIEWSVHVANQKAAWYQFQLAMDIPEVASADRTMRRNPSEADRSQLVIDPGPRSIRGPGKSGEEYAFDSGKFYGTPVYLGELQTDDRGRLIFLGGRGHSASRDGSKPTTFANNDGWHDDVSDGPVKATVVLDGREIPVEPAWVVVAPPNYAPNLKSVRTMYDLVFDVFVRDGRLPFPEQISFRGHIYPILKRLSDLQWVNQGFAAQFGWKGPWFFLDEEYLRKLSRRDPDPLNDQYAELRRQVYSAFRQFDRDSYSPVPWPWVYGDAMNVPPAKTSREHIALTDTQLRMLLLWATGSFEDDYDPNQGAPQSLDDVLLAERPRMLDEAALSECVADAFHPGCELTWPMRHGSLYAAPFRIRIRVTDDPEPEYGRELMSEEALAMGGPLYGQIPGGLTRWMAVPWQTDTASCRSGYTYSAGLGPQFDPFLPTFWPARVPNHVLTLDDYETVLDESLSPEERTDAFARRASWFRRLGDDYLEGLDIMVREFDKMGVVETVEGIPSDSNFPATMQVEHPPLGEDSGAPPHQGLVILHQPPDAERPMAALERAELSRGRPDLKLKPEEIVTGFVEKVARFPRGLKDQE